MAALDVAQYASLVLDDRDAQNLYEDAEAFGLTLLPDYTPDEHDPMATLLQCVATIVEAYIFALNRLPGTVLEVLLRLYGLVRGAGAPPTATITLSILPSSSPQTVPVGTRFSISTTALGTLLLATQPGVVIPASATTATIVAIGTVPTASFDGMPAGTQLQLIDSLTFVNSAVLAVPLSGGANPEDGNAFLTRGSQKLQALTDTYVLPSHFTVAALQQTGVVRALTIDEYDPTNTTSGNAPGSNPGHVTVAVADASGSPLPSAAKSTLLSTLQAGAASFLVVHIIDPTVTTVNVTITVQAASGVDPAGLQGVVTAALQGFLSPANWPWYGTVRVTQIIAAAAAVTGVAYVVSLNTPSQDIPLAGAAPLTTPGTIAVTVQPAPAGS